MPTIPLTSTFLIRKPITFLGKRGYFGFLPPRSLCGLSTGLTLTRLIVTPSLPLPSWTGLIFTSILPPPHFSNASTNTMPNPCDKSCLVLGSYSQHKSRHGHPSLIAPLLTNPSTCDSAFCGYKDVFHLHVGKSRSARESKLSGA